jgi:alpha-amylase/alpha-mannosidase (GH57 family)
MVERVAPNRRQIRKLAGGNTRTMHKHFPDYETFGEHHWPETGIHEFSEAFAKEILKWWHLHMATPSEVVEKYEPAGEIDVQSLAEQFLGLIWKETQAVGLETPCSGLTTHL